MTAGPNDQNAAEFDRWYRIGIQAVDCESWLYALECLTKAVTANPNHREARKQKHRASRRVFQQSGGPSKTEKLKLTAIKSRLLSAEARGDWDSVDGLAEEVLTRNPWDGTMFAAVARTAEKRGSLEVAEYAWVCAVKIDGTQVKWFRALGDLLHRSGRYDEARQCYSRIQQIDPASRGGEELMQAVDVASLMRDGGVHLRRAYEASEIAEEPELCGDSEDAQAQKSLKIVEQTIKKAEQFVRSDQLGQALERYQQAVEQLPGHIGIKDRCDDIRLALLRKRASAAAVAAGQQPDSQSLQASAMQYAETFHQQEFEILTLRVERNSDNLLQVFRLADLCRRTGRLQQAIELFQRSVEDHKLHAESLIGLGECCLRSNQAGIGRRHLEAALTKISSDEHPNSVKLAHYWLARYFEAAKAVPQAIWHYERVSVLDPCFRDVAQRSMKLRSQSGAAATEA